MTTTFYELPLDSYNQALGYVREIQMTDDEFRMKHPNRYIFRDKREAERRAIN